DYILVREAQQVQILLIVPIIEVALRIRSLPDNLDGYRHTSGPHDACPNLPEPSGTKNVNPAIDKITRRVMQLKSQSGHRRLLSFWQVNRKLAISSLYGPANFWVVSFLGEIKGEITADGGH